METKLILPYRGNLKQQAQQLRVNMTDAERRLWARIRMNQLNEYRFYRQKPIGRYIVDFYCPKAKLVVEVDGGQHFDTNACRQDQIRDNYLRTVGLKVLRFTNIDVLTNIEGVVGRILENLGEEISLSPSLRKRETAKIPLNPPLRKGEKVHPSVKEK
ncbi:MAG: endonuclease domain-containing protein [Dehalococcoidales bacterium]|nr:endonuclease domain-containing protein [Dehalococcoidales bacterium]